jgi:hypothetical protein
MIFESFGAGPQELRALAGMHRINPAAFNGAIAQFLSER